MATHMNTLHMVIEMIKGMAQTDRIQISGHYFEIAKTIKNLHCNKHTAVLFTPNAALHVVLTQRIGQTAAYISPMFP